MDWQRALEVAVAACHRAGSLHLQLRDQGLDIGSKSTFADLVTRADRESELAIRQVIAAAFPDHAVVGEEGGQLGDSRYRWIVDPLDGTVNYAHGFPFSCVSVALEVEGQTRVGAVFDPNRQELFSAIRGQGARCNGHPIRVSACPDLETPALLATGFPYDPAEGAHNLELFSRFLRLGLPVRRPGAAALDLCYLAAGRLDGFWEFKLNPWDVAAGILIIQEAGGQVTDLSGETYRYGGPLLASNGRIHRQMRAILSP
jgi:myo-inositol-1(or 4)-monophosphatase